VKAEAVFGFRLFYSGRVHERGDDCQAYSLRHFAFTLPPVNLHSAYIQHDNNKEVLMVDNE
jgi:hypothetical protein